MRNLYDLIGATRPGRDLSVSDDSLAFFQLVALPSPIHFVPDAVRDIRSLGKYKPHYARMIVVEPGIVGRNHRIMLSRPLQIIRVLLLSIAFARPAAADTVNLKYIGLQNQRTYFSISGINKYKELISDSYDNKIL